MAFTFFFRDLQVIELAVRHLVPEIMGRSRSTIWDAGCAMGPEPYTLAIVLAEQMGRFAFQNLRIFATDYDESGNFGQIIEEGIYSWRELERVPSELFQRYFEPASQAEHYKVLPIIRDRVIFQKHDLLSLQPIGQNFSLILCKNVLLHFQPAQRVDVLRMFYQALGPGGFLAFEHTQKMPDELQPLFQQVSGEGQLFRKV